MTKHPAEPRRLSHRQLMIWTGQKLDPEIPLYNMTRTFAIDGELEPEAFVRAFAALVDHSDALQLVVVERDGLPLQQINPATDRVLPFIDFSSHADPTAAAEAWVAEQGVKRFDLGRQLFDSALLRVGPDRHLWFLNQHHLIADAWSASVLLDRLGRLYELALVGDLGEADTTPSYLDFLDSELGDGATAEAAVPVAADAAVNMAADAAVNMAADAAVAAPLTFYGPRPAEAGTETVRVEADLSGPRAMRLQEFLARPEIQALSPELTVLRAFHTVLFAYLHRIAGQDRLAVGTPIHNRPSRRMKATAGLFMDLQPVAVEIEDGETMTTLLDKVGRELFTGLMQGGTSPTDKLDEPAVEVVCNYIHASFESFADLAVTPRWWHPGAGDRSHSIRLQILREGDGLRLLFDLKTELFDHRSRQAVVDHFLAILDCWIDEVDIPLRDLHLLSQQQFTTLVTEFNHHDQPAAPPDDDTTVVELFEARAAADPEAIACRDQGEGSAEGETWSYRRLDDRATTVAHALAKIGVRRGSMVAVYQRRTGDALATILAILKLGAAFVPLEPGTPSARLAEVADQAALAAVATEVDLAPALSDLAVPLLTVDTINSVDTVATIAGRPAGPLDTPPGADDVAYVIFTSGSTGRPKGVPVQHRGLANYVTWAGRHYCGDDRLRFALFTSLAFDLTLTSIFVPLTTGGEVIVYPDDELSGTPPIVSVWQDDRANVIKLTPSHLAVVRRLPDPPTNLQALIVGGENFVGDLAADIQRLVGPNVAIYNEYGPTETVVGCMIHRFDANRDRWPSVPIGRPAAGAGVYLLDRHGLPVPPGVTGEIHIGGPGLSPGYLSRPELTAERFVAPRAVLGLGPDARLYRSGDLARWRTNTGQPELELLGRADDQVKIRGHRIELGELEAALASVPEVRAAAATVVTETIGSLAASADTVEYCVRCGLSSRYPQASMDEGVCSLCRHYETYRHKVDDYFRNPAELQTLAERIKDERPSESDYDCLVLLSGGKDSTYMLYQVAALGLRPLVFTLDNGFISEEAKANCRRVTDHLGFDLVMGSTPHMNEIFRDSLDRFANVCNGCFKTIYTLSVNLAREHGLNHIITGLARGQLFETRLSDMYDHQIFDVEQIDAYIIEARKVYHRLDDAVSRHLDVSAFADDRVFDEIAFVDFYRYTDVELGHVLEFLNAETPWVRPSDTGRSTNCLINDVGIHVHQQEKGFHNYAFPYSWDVRLGHKQRDAALAELDDDIDEEYVNEVLVEIGYKPKPPPAPHITTRLVGYYVAAETIDGDKLRSGLAATLPDYMIPQQFVRLDEMPLTVNGKVDRAALPDPTPGAVSDSTGPELDDEANELATALRSVWGEIFGRQDIGLHDNFFDLGGDSIVGIQIVAKAVEAGITLQPRLVFECQTIAALALAVAGAPTLTTVAEQGAVTGAAPLTPIQHRFFELDHDNPNHWNQMIQLGLPDAIDVEAMCSALAAVFDHHDAFCTRFTVDPDGVRHQQFGQEAGSVAEQPPITVLDRSNQSGGQEAIDQQLADLNGGFNLETGPLVGALLVLDDTGKNQLFIAAHHLVVDGVSWYAIIGDLETAYRNLSAGGQPGLPPKTSSYRQWSTAVAEQVERVDGPQWPELARKLQAVEPLWPTGPLRRDGTAHVSTELDREMTRLLIHEANGAYRTEITELLLTALVRALSTVSERDRFLIDVESHGRDLLDADSGRAAMTPLDTTRTVGWFTAIGPVLFSPGDRGPTGPKNSPGADIGAVKEAYRNQSAGGRHHDLLRFCSTDADVRSALSARPAASVLFNYLGQLDQMTAGSDLFTMNSQSGHSSSLLSGQGMNQSIGHQNRQEHPVELGLYVSDGQLRAKLTYHRTLHTESEANSLLTTVMAEIATIVEHCVAEDAGSVSPADFELATLSQDEFDRLSSLLDD